MHGDLRLDHVVIGTRDLRACAETYDATLGFTVLPGGTHTGRGTHNALIDLGDCYLELIAVHDEREASAADRGGLARYLRGSSGGLAAYAVATGDIDGLAEHLRDLGLHPVGPFPMTRAQADGRTVSWRLLIPDGDQYRRPWPFFIQWDTPKGDRLGGSEDTARHPSGVRRVAELAVAVDALDRVADTYASILGYAAVRRGTAPGLSARYAAFDLGGTGLTLLSPTGEGPVAEAIRAEGQGPFRVTVEVGSLAAARERLGARGVALSPAPGVLSGVLVSAPGIGSLRMVLVEAGPA